MTSSEHHISADTPLALAVAIALHRASGLPLEIEVDANEDTQLSVTRAGVQLSLEWFIDFRGMHERTAINKSATSCWCLMEEDEFLALCLNAQQLPETYERLVNVTSKHAISLLGEPRVSKAIGAHLAP